ncbi:hypothetical protein ACH4F6_34120 [Streptomyces sp. NPDC017936]|uniref:hypothetical protein n=1 Tax=Streptomyces sp. NPDC017936 TaxID=3365016 RepID=UPI0037B5DCEF
MSEDGLEEGWTPPPGYLVEIGTEPLDRPARNSVGGWPCLDDGQEWPQCFCGERTALFFPLDLPDDIEFFGGEHLSVFHCAHHHDAADPCGRRCAWQPPVVPPQFSGPVTTSRARPAPVKSAAVRVHGCMQALQWWKRAAPVGAVRPARSSYAHRSVRLGVAIRGTPSPSRSATTAFLP